MKQLVVSLKDIQGVPHGSQFSRTNVRVIARYTSEIVLTDGTIVPNVVVDEPVSAPGGSVTFDVWASDDPAVKAEYRDFAIRVDVQVSPSRGTSRKGGYTKTAKVLMSSPSPVQFGSLPGAEGLPPKWTSVADFRDEFEALVVEGQALVAQNADTLAAAQQAQALADAAATRAENAEAASLEVPDVNVSALVGNPSTDTAEALRKTSTPKLGDVGRGGRGRISITFDDAMTSHFTTLLPLSMKMGFPIGTAWHTANGNDALVEKAWREGGWEIMSHHPQNDKASDLTESELIGQAESSVAKIVAITGDPNNIGFVYPQHARTKNTDRILSRYYTWGRGEALFSPDRGGRPWLVCSRPFDAEHDTSGNITEKLKADLRAVAVADSAVSLYGHYQGDTVNPGRVQALINIVNYARSLGIQIVRPSDIRGRTDIGGNAGTGFASGWTVGSGSALSTERVIKSGDTSIKVTPTAGTGWFASTSNLTGYKPTPSTPGMFTVYRASLRYHATASIATSPGFGFRFGFARIGFPMDGGPLVALDGGGVVYESEFKSDLPAAEWGLLSSVIAFGPDCAQVQPRLMLANVAQGTAPFYLADFRFDRIDTVAALSYTATLNGTAGVDVPTAVIGVARCGVMVTPLAATAGRVYAVPSEVASRSDRVRVHSTDASDTTQKVQVTVLPPPSYKDLAITNDGA